MPLSGAKQKSFPYVTGFLDRDTGFERFSKDFGGILRSKERVSRPTGAVMASNVS